MNKGCVGASAFFAFVACGMGGVAAEEITSAPAVVLSDATTSLQWTGFYVGADGGYGWSRSAVSFSPNDPAAQAGTCGGTGHGQCIPSVDLSLHGPIAGGQAGFNWQISRLWMTGIEVDYQWSDISGTGTSPFHLGNVGNTNVFTNQSITSFGTLRARMGVLPIGAVLFYGTGGLAFGHASETFTMPSARGGALSVGGFSYSCGAAGTTCFAGSSSRMMFGWTVGAGGELALTPRVTFKTEILLVDLGSPRGTMTAQAAAAGTTPSSFSVSLAPLTMVLVRGGLNFRF